MRAQQDSDLAFAFYAGRSGSGPATWGQHAIWSVVTTLGSEAFRYNVCGGGVVDPGLPVTQIVTALQELFLLHDSLRTTLHGDGSGRLTQRLHSSGAAVVTVRRCEPEAVEDEAAALFEDLAAQSFDFERDWPARFGVVESGGLVRRMVLALSHTAVDAWGLRHLVDDMSTLTHGGLSARQLREQRPERLQPLEEAQYQASDRGRRQDAAARRHWRTKLDAGPRRMFRAAQPGGADGAEPLKFPNAQLDSPALGPALRKVAAAHAVSPSAVALAAAAAMTARLSGAEDAMFQVVVNNRFLPGLENAVSTVAQEGIFHLPRANGDFPDLIRRAFGSSLSAYRNAYYHKASLDRDVAQLREQAADVGDLTCIVNDWRGVRPAAAKTQPTDTAQPTNTAQADEAMPSAPLDGDAIEQARSRTVLHWPVECEPRPEVSFALDVIDGPDGPDSAGLSMTADPALLPRPQMERFLYGIEDLVVAEALALG